MSQWHYREIVCEGCIEAEIVDEHTKLDLQKFAQSCGQSPEWILQLLDFDILSTRGNTQQDTASLHFSGEDITRARRAYRLQRDFEASLSAVAMMMELIDEVQRLRQQTRYSQNK